MIGPSRILAADNPNGYYIPAPHLRVSSPITTSSPILSMCDTLAITCIKHHYLHLRRDICDIHTCFHHKTNPAKLQRYPTTRHNDLSFKDKTLPWNDEASGNDDISWDEKGRCWTSWNEADIIDSTWFEDAPRFYSDVASFDAHDDDTSRYPDDAHDDALEDYLNAFFDEVNRSANRRREPLLRRRRKSLFQRLQKH